jgi:hypothetical protein
MNDHDHLLVSYPRPTQTPLTLPKKMNNGLPCPNFPFPKSPIIQPWSATKTPSQPPWTRFKTHPPSYKSNHQSHQFHAPLKKDKTLVPSLSRQHPSPFKIPEQSKLYHIENKTRWEKKNSQKFPWSCYSRLLAMSGLLIGQGWRKGEMNNKTLGREDERLKFYYETHLFL